MQMFIGRFWLIFKSLLAIACNTHTSVKCHALMKAAVLELVTSGIYSQPCQNYYIAYSLQVMSPSIQTLHYLFVGGLEFLVAFRTLSFQYVT